jgi:hypothetical protein
VSETDIKRAIVQAMNASGLCRVWSTPSGRVQIRGGWVSLAPEGTPDICGWSRDGRFVGVEVKVPGHKTKPERATKQQETQAAIRSAGGIAGQVESALAAIELLTSYFHTQHPTPTETPP